MPDLSLEQQTVVDAPLEPLSVIACAGSGKTRTAVRRLLEIRRRLDANRGYIALLSFSNVAVQMFRNDYLALLQEGPCANGRLRVIIETVDSFISKNILSAHAYRTMGAPRHPFLIGGNEPFLQNEKFKFWASPKTGNAFPVPADQVGVSLAEGNPTFYYSMRGGSTIPIYNGKNATEQLGAIGAYTHNIGRYWAHRTLSEQPLVLRAFAHRFPCVLVDEAQDIGTIHQEIFALLASAGVQISLIGDPNQAIYEFAGADGSYLAGYAAKTGAASFTLTTNYRSVPNILCTAAAVANQNVTAHRTAPLNRHGAFFVPYAPSEKPRLVEAFKSSITASGLALARTVVVCRGRDLTNELKRTHSEYGQGIVRGFVTATILRDSRRDFLQAFEVTAGCIVALLSKAQAGLFSKLLNVGHFPELKPLRRLLWTFVRNSEMGLPLASLVADTEWHPLLLKRVRILLDSLKTDFGFQPANHIGHKLAKKGLPNTPLAIFGVPEEEDNHIRIDTVHQVKGESLNAVFYVATKPNVQALVGGVGTEDGRIGYVALTRARDLFWLGVPTNSLPELKGPLLALGFKEWVGLATD